MSYGERKTREAVGAEVCKIERGEGKVAQRASPGDVRKVHLVNAFSTKSLFSTKDEIKLEISNKALCKVTR